MRAIELEDALDYRKTTLVVMSNILDRTNQQQIDHFNKQLQEYSNAALGRDDKVELTDIEDEKKFQKIFSRFKDGKNPTPLKNIKIGRPSKSKKNFSVSVEEFIKGDIDAKI